MMFFNACRLPLMGDCHYYCHHFREGGSGVWGETERQILWGKRVDHLLCNRIRTQGKRRHGLLVPYYDVFQCLSAAFDQGVFIIVVVLYKGRRRWGVRCNSGANSLGVSGAITCYAIKKNAGEAQARYYGFIIMMFSMLIGYLRWWGGSRHNIWEGGVGVWGVVKGKIIWDKLANC